MWDAIKKWFSGGSKEQGSMSNDQPGACPKCGMPMTEGHSHETESSMPTGDEGSMSSGDDTM